ncbi:MAG: esterase [Prolixibacteraceae bacterium]|nr:esterase [Prolixibacteraceae bacterium]
MKKKLLLFAICLFLISWSFAQELANFSRRAPIISPEIGETNVSFRIAAPEAKSVKLSGSWMTDNNSPVDLMKNENGVWSVTIPTPDPELYTYNFIVDGLSVNDASNIFLQRDGTRYLSVLLVPGELTENYFEANKHGNLHQVWYNSPTLGMERRLFVYTPYGYDESNEKYPVLYLLHGAGGDEDAWSNMGRTRQILDNLIEKGLAKPMICVMPNGNPTQAAAQPLMIKEKQADRNSFQNNSYVESIVKDIVPFIEKTYRVDAKPESRAIAGLSMGGGHTISASLAYPGFFQYICPLSMGINFRGEGSQEEYNKQFQALKKEGYKLYFLACGNSDFLIESARTLDKTLTANGLEHIYYENTGGHTWSNWRIYLNKFAPMLFK